MKPDTITVTPTCLIISIWAYRRMGGVHCCNRIGVSLCECNRMSVSPWGVVTSILTRGRVIRYRGRRCAPHSAW